VYDGVDRTLDVSQGGSHVLDVSIPVPALQVTFHDPGGVYADVQRTLDVSQGRSHVLDVSIPAPALQLTFHDPGGCWEQTGVGVDLEPGPQAVDAAMGRRGVGFLTVGALIDRARRRISQLAKRADDPDLQPSPADDQALKDVLSEGLTEVATKTDRLQDVIERTVEKGQAELPLPPRLDVIQEATLEPSGSRPSGSRKSFGLDVGDGHRVAQRARTSSEGRPTRVGSHAGRLHLAPPPDRAYALTIVGTVNGAYYETRPYGTDRWTLCTLLQHVPAEMERGLVAYVVSKWFEANGELELAQTPREEFERDLLNKRHEPRSQTSTSRPYNPLGL